MAETVCDTSPLQYLYQIGLIHVLPALFGDVVVPRTVALEIEEGRARMVSLPELPSLPWIRVESPHPTSLVALLTDLGPGERDVIALAAAIPVQLEMEKAFPH